MHRKNQTTRWATAVMALVVVSFGMTATGAIIECRCDVGHVTPTVAAEHEHHCDAHGPVPADEHEHQQGVPCDDVLVVLDDCTRPDQQDDAFEIDSDHLFVCLVTPAVERALCVSRAPHSTGPPRPLVEAIASTVLRI